MESIRVLVVDDVPETRENIRRLLSFDSSLVVVGEARDGVEAVQKAAELAPDVVLMDVNMPRLNGLAAAEKIMQDRQGCSVIFLSVQNESEYLRKAMAAGGRDYLVKPFSGDELISAINRVYRLENRRAAAGMDNKAAARGKPQVITVFGSKGGVGKTTIAVNTAVLLAQAKKKVAVLDLDLQFGDISVFLNLMPSRTIAELVQEGGDFDLDLVESYMVSHPSGVRVLPAPSRPEHAELVAVPQVERIVDVLKAGYDYVIIDTPPMFNDTNLCALDLSTQVFLVLALDLATIKNVKLSLELMQSLHHLGKTKLILNRASDDVGIKTKTAERLLGFLIAAKIPSDGKLCISALNRGVPFVLSAPGAKISQAMRALAEMIIHDRGYQEDLKQRRKATFLGRLLK